MFENLDLKKLSALGCLTASFLWTGPASGMDFIRGDANGDRTVSISDAQKLASFLFRYGDWPECLNAADANDSGGVDIADVAAIASYLFGHMDVLPAPFPEEGPDPTANPDIGWGMASECESYGGGSLLEDPIAKVEILDATCRGGEDGKVSLTVLVSSSTSLGGYWGQVRTAGDVIADVRQEVEDLTGTVTAEAGWLSARITEGVLRFGGLLSAKADVFIPPGRDIVALGVAACLKEGTPAGEYPLVLEAGELVDWDSSRAIRSSLTGGTLTVLQDVTAGTDCSVEPPPLPPVNAVYRLGGVAAVPGGTAAVNFIMRADAVIQGYSFSVDFDEDVLEASRVEQVWDKPDGSEYSFAVYEIDNERSNPGSGGVDEGFVVGAAVIDFHEPIGMPADTDNLAVRLHFRVSPEATSGVTQLEFMPGGQVSGDPVPNTVAAYGETYTPDMATSFVFLAGSVEILPDITLFIRGDSNNDQKVDLSDAATTLGFLFLGSSRPRCFDAADANDDGTLNIADPIFTLQFLFLGGTSVPSPYPAEGEDPTEDGMTCLSLSS